MKLSEKYRPKSLNEVIGQPPTLMLRKFAANPYPSCWLLESAAPGVGKTATAYALAHDIGCEDEFSGLKTVIASDLLIDPCRQLFEQDLRMRPMFGSGWKVLVIEELELLTDKVQNYLKVVLETRLPEKCIVIATSNGAGRLSKALLQRFQILSYSGGECFAAAAREFLATVWQQEFGDLPMPHGWDEFGWDAGDYSLRRALDSLQISAMASAA